MVEIVIFILPSELPAVEETLIRLRTNIAYLSDTQRAQLIITVILGLSDNVVDWNKSAITLDDVKTRFYALGEYITNTKLNLIASDSIEGCTSARRESTKSNSDWYIWLDSDIIFAKTTLAHVFNAIDGLTAAGVTDVVITPETVRLWDSTWDCLVNSKFLSAPLGYQKTNNPYADSQTYINALPPVEIAVEQVQNWIPGQPKMKFAGGWFTVISKSLLAKIPIPDTFSHYGLEDTYIMWGCELACPEAKQFKLKNVIVCENYRNRDDFILKNVVLIDVREKYRQANQALFSPELTNLIQRRQSSV